MGEQGGWRLDGHLNSQRRHLKNSVGDPFPQIRAKKGRFSHLAPIVSRCQMAGESLQTPLCLGAETPQWDEVLKQWSGKTAGDVLLRNLSYRTLELDIATLVHLRCGDLVTRSVLQIYQPQNSDPGDGVGIGPTIHWSFRKQATRVALAPNGTPGRHQAKRRRPLVSQRLPIQAHAPTPFSSLTE
uniref:Uncharacterized protein n=1 Tax=Coccidioides posadasii RMSCC 3488 TaxID=454284 RepID=A0A0J6FI62_COCPO|nr:hypothetical protein CPAG_04851 [Coccidioides posadasii RMSCC 3488]